MTKFIFFTEKGLKQGTTNIQHMQLSLKNQKQRSEYQQLLISSCLLQINVPKATISIWKRRTEQQK